MSPALAGRFFTTSATWEAQNRRLPYSPSQRNSNLVWVFPEADPRQGSGGKKYTWEMKKNIGRGGRQGREAGWWRGLLSGFILEFNFAGETVQFTSVQFSCSVVSNSLQPHGLQHARPPCPSPIPGVYPNSCLLSRWCLPTISSSVVPFSSCPQYFPASGSFQMSQLFISGGQSIGVSTLASVLPMNTQDWSPLGWTGWISLQSKGFSRVFSNTTVQKHQSFGAQFSL